MVRRTVVVPSAQHLSNNQENEARFQKAVAGTGSAGSVSRWLHAPCHSAPFFQRSTMRLGTAFATTVAVAVAPRGVSADGNSVSSKLQVHVSRPAHVIGTGKCNEAHGSVIYRRTVAASCSLLPTQLWKWTGGFLASLVLPLPTQGGSSRLII